MILKSVFNEIKYPRYIDGITDFVIPHVKILDSDWSRAMD